jgi:tetratricopeptide (TPR) repeat protein
MLTAQLAQGPFTTSVIANEWLLAAAAHRPGTRDAALQKIAGWDFDRVFRTLTAIHQANASDRLNGLLERGALLHADISFLSRHTRQPPLLKGWSSSRAATLIKDGQRVGVGPLDPHLHVARDFLRAMRPPLFSRVDSEQRDFIRKWEAARARNPRIRQWYRAVSADLAVLHWLSDQLPHLEAARRMLPGDSSVLFDEGCAAELIASPQIQRALPRPTTPSTMSSRREDYDLFLFQEGRNLEAAERAYREVLQLDPGHAEAQVRLARVLSRRGRHADAISLLGTNIETSDPIVRYYAALVVAGAAEEDGRTELATESYQRASTLFPRAQSPLLAMLRLARDLGDTSAAKETAATFATLGPVEKGRMDPWWEYYDCNGRNRDRELERLWQLFTTAR